MTKYSRSAYDTNPNAGRSPNGASGRGWGPGWPNCQTSKIVKVTNGDHSVNVRREIAELVATLFKITALRKYDVNPAGEPNQTWGFACRAIANTKTPSNHSWGLAVDINAPHNGYGFTFQCDIPPVVVNDWEVCDFYWGGRYTKKFDAMHFEYIGRPQDVAKSLAKAQDILAALLRPSMPPASKNQIDVDNVAYAANGGYFHSGQQAALDDARTVVEWLRDKRQYISARDARVWEDRIKMAKASDAKVAWQSAGLQYAGIIKRFQVATHLKADGIVGPSTKMKLVSELTRDHYRAVQ